MVSKNKNAGLPFPQYELGRDSAVSVIFQRHIGGERQSQEVGAENRSGGGDHGLMREPAVIEGGAAYGRNPGRPANAADTPIKMMVLGRIGGQPGGHEVFHFGDAIRQQKARYQDIGGRPVKLLLPHAVSEGGNLKPSALFVVEDGPEYAGRVELRITVPVNGTVLPHQRDGAHVADDAVVFDRLIGHWSNHSK